MTVLQTVCTLSSVYVYIYICIYIYIFREREETKHWEMVGLNLEIFPFWKDLSQPPSQTSHHSPSRASCCTPGDESGDCVSWLQPSERQLLKYPTQSVQAHP